MRRRHLIAAGAIFSLSGAGLFHQAQAVTSCKENNTCREITADVEAIAPDIIPWDQIWALDSQVAAPAPVRSAEHTAYNMVGKGLILAGDVPAEIGEETQNVVRVLEDVVPARDIYVPGIPPRDTRPPKVSIDTARG